MRIYVFYGVPLKDRVGLGGTVVRALISCVEVGGSGSAEAALVRQPAIEMGIQLWVERQQNMMLTHHS